MLGPTATDTGSPPRFHWLLTRADDDDETQASTDYAPELNAEYGATVTVTLKGPAPATYLLLVRQIGTATTAAAAAAAVTADGPEGERVEENGVGNDDVVLAETRVVVACKYVRRELRDLTPADSETFFRAMGELYSVSIDQGKAKYGDKFANSKIMAAYHHSSVSNQTVSRIRGFFAELSGGLTCGTYIYRLSCTHEGGRVAFHRIF